MKKSGKRDGSKAEAFGAAVDGRGGDELPAPRPHRPPSFRRRETPLPPPVPPAAARLRALRKVLRMSQKTLADRGLFSPLDVADVERGEDRAESYAMRANLARGVGVPIEVLADYLDGGRSLDEVLRVRKAEAARRKSPAQ